MVVKQTVAFVFILSVALLVTRQPLQIEQQDVLFLNERSFEIGCSSSNNVTQQQNNRSSGSARNVVYRPSHIEDYVHRNATRLGYTELTASGCAIWKDPKATTIFDDLQAYDKELNAYIQAVRNFKWAQENGITDVRQRLSSGICEKLELKSGKDLQTALFSTSQGLSLFGGGVGFVEPLLPPMRLHHYCDPQNRSNKVLYSLDYLVHDFAQMCRTLQPTSRTILVDLGASPSYYGERSPTYVLMDLYNKFGISFDHIYAYELRQYSVDEVYNKLIPPHLLPALHWINTGVSIEVGHPLNPWTMIENKYNEDDLIIVKLDIDTGSLEVPLANQLLNSPKLCSLVDQFYFEHHVHLSELAPNWKKSMQGSIKESLDLFQGLRKRGVASHFWP